MAYIQFLGAAGTVTGSKHLINTGDPSRKNGFRVLIDCGLFQGPKEWRERNWRDTPVSAKEIDAVILTHAHLDHCGWIPRLVKEGFRGPIYASSPTIDLCGIILPDSGHLQEEDAAFYNKTRKSKHTPALPLYTFEEAQEFGIVNDIFERENFMEQVMDYAKQFTPPNKASKAVGRIKRAVQSGVEMSFTDGLALERELQQLLFESDDAREGIAANLEKRKPIFRGT